MNEIRKLKTYSFIEGIDEILLEILLSSSSYLGTPHPKILLFVVRMIFVFFYVKLIMVS